MNTCEACDELIIHDDGWCCADCGGWAHHECEKPAMVDANDEMWCEGCAAKAAEYLHLAPAERRSA